MSRVRNNVLLGDPDRPRLRRPKPVFVLDSSPEKAPELRLFWRTLGVVPVVSLLLGFGACPSPPEPRAPRFTDVSSQLGLSRQAAEYGPLWADLDSDGQLDLIFMNHGLPSFYFNSGGDIGFVNRVLESGIRTGDWLYDQHGDRHGGSCADYDNDGDVDLFIAHGAKRGETVGVKYDELLRNRGDGTFDEVSLEAGALNRLGRSRTGIWGDYNRDGWLDLYIGNFESLNVLYRNNKDGTFSEVSTAANPAATGPRVAWADLNEDGEPDLVVGWPLRVFRNLRGTAFEDVTRKSGLDSPDIFPFSFAFGDADNDGDLDAFIGSVTSEGALFYNNSGVFVRGPSMLLGVEEKGAGAAWGDLDNDGDLDLLRAGAHNLRLYLNLGNQKFSIIDLWHSEGLLESGGEVALGDYDGDGYLDVAFDTSTRQMLLKNSGGTNAWIQLTFIGNRSNRSGYGTRVWVRPRSGSLVGQTLYRQYWGDNSAYNSSGCGPLHVGLADASSVDLRALWPSGQETVLRDIPVKQAIRVEEPNRE